jgi:hypothetical protein
VGITQPSGSFGERKDILSVAGIEMPFLGCPVIITIVTACTGDVI